MGAGGLRARPAACPGADLIVAHLRVTRTQQRHRPKTLLESLTLCAAKRRHSGAPTLENVKQSRSAASRACHVAPAPIRGHWRAFHAPSSSFLLSDLAV